MDTDYWLHFHIRDDEFPNLNCSKCKEGKLFIKEKIKHYETYNSRLKLFDEFNYSETDLEYKFVGFLECNNYRCKEIYTITGTLTREPDEPYEDGSGQLCQDLFNYYSPEFISPPLEIIELKKEYPTTVSAALYDSFKLFFADNEACANKIRIALELLLDELGVTQLNKKGVDLALGIRIAEYEERDEKNAKLMKATKIIGNFGSHRKKIERKDVLDGYELLKAVLDDLYDNESEKLKHKAEQINSQNKPISKIGK